MIPLFHDKQEALEEQIISLAPVGNPLREFFLDLREKESGTSGLH